MMVRRGVLLACCVAVAIATTGVAANAHELLDRAHRLERAGDRAEARALLTRGIQATPADAELLTGYAEDLEAAHDREAVAAYRRAAAEWKRQSKLPNAAAAQRRAVLLDLIAGDQTAARTDLAEYRALGGVDLEMPVPSAAAVTFETIDIPGPYRSFARMAAISADAGPADILPAFAHNIVSSGYQAGHAGEQLTPTEYLKLVQRYLSQARELDKLAGADRFIRVPNCDSTQTNDLLRVLGYRMRGACGGEVVLETVNAARAFLTSDSGFPLARLEDALRTDKPFAYDFRPGTASVLYSVDYWIGAKEKAAGDFVDAMMADPTLCRYYLALSKLDPETAGELRRSISSTRLRALSSVLDFFGGNFEIRDGKAVLPGGARASSGWAELAGASPDHPADFFDKLMVKDDGWLASLYDALARIHGPLQDYLTEPARMKRFYAAVRGKITTPGPARPVFRSNADLMLLTTRIEIEPNGKPHLPGNIDVWRNLFEKGPRKYDLKIGKAAAAWQDADDVLEALFALCRKPVDNEPLRIFMALGAIDRGREHPLAAETADRLARSWSTFGGQYPLFSEAPTLSDRTILAWMDAAQAVDKMRDSGFRQDGVGMFQGLSSLWQIFVRHGSISASRADESLAAIVAPFNTLKSDRELFDAGRQGLNILLKSAGSETGPAHDRIMALLAGGSKVDTSPARIEFIQREQRFFDAQKLLSPDLVFDLADNLEGVSRGEKLNAQLAQRLAGRVADIQLPRAAMTFEEKGSQSFGYWVDKHLDEERKLNLRAMIDKASKDTEKLKDIRGLLAPALRDTIVGYSYLHYAPPGAQILLTNPLFVRGHDFIGTIGSNNSWKPTSMYGSGWPSNAGGRLIGSLAELPYALAESEKDFLVPTQTQALIWGDLVPQMILSATTPRFWDVTPAQLHWVSLNVRYAEAMVAESALGSKLRPAVFGAIASAASPNRAADIVAAISDGNVGAALAMIMPSELYAIGTAMPAMEGNPLSREIAAARSDDTTPQAISKIFGTPKPTLASSYRPELLGLRTFPTLMGYSSRIMAESWESNQLYFAALADEMEISPARLNLLVPEWTQKVVERIFASHLEDWPALLRSLRSVGEELRRPVAGVRTANKD